MSLSCLYPVNYCGLCQYDAFKNCQVYVIMTSCWFQEQLTCCQSVSGFKELSHKGFSHKGWSHKGSSHGGWSHKEWYHNAHKELSHK